MSSSALPAIQSLRAAIEAEGGVPVSSPSPSDAEGGVLAYRRSPPGAESRIPTSSPTPPGAGDGRILECPGGLSFGFSGGAGFAEWKRRQVDSDGLGAVHGALVCAMAYADPMDEPPDSLPLGASIGRFARSNAYAALAARLLRVRDALRADLHYVRSQLRVLVNSRLAEKPLAVLAGLGSVGRQSLVLAKGLGPGVVLGALLLPFDPLAGGPPGRDPGQAAPEPANFEPGARCGGCVACVEACPTGAVSLRGGIDRERCLQAAASHEAALPPRLGELWTDLVYGCDRCTVACPRFVRGAMGPQDAPGRLGARLGFDLVLGAADADLKAFLRESALGLAWMRPRLWRRNALLAAGGLAAALPGHPGLAALFDLVAPYAESEDALLREAAGVAIARFPGFRPRDAGI